MTFALKRIIMFNTLTLIASIRNNSYCAPVGRTKFQGISGVQDEILHHYEFF
jgi:hypothetical protein